ncbi:MAG: ATP synthase F1 subunit epsilon [Clostridia bacterium]|nr:ATP synthase F1 subunit epsilon [Clostridia bacterium]
MNAFRLDVFAAEKTFYSGDCVSIVVPTVDGLYGILAHHTNMIAAVTPGVLKLRTPAGEEIVAAVSEGLIKVENNTVLVLVDTAEHPEEIDENRARLAAEHAKEELLQKKSIQDYYNAQFKMARAIGRLKAKKHEHGLN